MVSYKPGFYQRQEQPPQRQPATTYADYRYLTPDQALAEGVITREQYNEYRIEYYHELAKQQEQETQQPQQSIQIPNAPSYLSELGLTSTYNQTMQDLVSGKITEDQANKILNDAYQQKFNGMNEAEQQKFLTQHVEEEGFITDQKQKDIILASNAAAEGLADELIRGDPRAIGELRSGAFIEAFSGNDYQRLEKLLDLYDKQKTPEDRAKVRDMMIDLLRPVKAKELGWNLGSYLLSLPMFQFAMSYGVGKGLGILSKFLPVATKTIGVAIGGQFAGEAYKAQRQGKLSEFLIQSAPSIVGGLAGGLTGVKSFKPKVLTRAQSFLEKAPGKISTGLKRTFPDIGVNYVKTAKVTGMREVPSTLGRQSTVQLSYRTSIEYTPKMLREPFKTGQRVFERFKPTYEKLTGQKVKVKTGELVGTQIRGLYGEVPLSKAKILRIEKAYKPGIKEWIPRKEYNLAGYLEKTPLKVKQLTYKPYGKPTFLEGQISREPYVAEAGSRRMEFGIKSISKPKLKIKYLEVETRKGPVTSAEGGISTTIQEPRTGEISIQKQYGEIKPYFRTELPELKVYYPKFDSFAILPSTKSQQLRNQISIQKPGQIKSPIVSPIQIPEQIKIVEPAFILETKQEQLQELKPLQEQETRQDLINLLTPYSTSKTLTRMRFPGIPVTEEKEKRTSEQSYNTYAKKDATKNARLIQVGRNLPLQQALGVGAKSVDETVSRTFIVRKSTQPAKSVSEYSSWWGDLQHKYRPPKNKKAGTYVEKTTYAIDTKGEHEGITVQGWIAKRAQTKNPKQGFKSQSISRKAPRTFKTSYKPYKLGMVSL